jgi:dipeptide/tripeptide permease
VVPTLVNQNIRLIVHSIYVVGLSLLCGVSFDDRVAQRGGLGFFLVCLLLIAIGSGGIRVNMNAFIGRFHAAIRKTFP